jgi:hypothetical protein
MSLGVELVGEREATPIGSASEEAPARLSSPGLLHGEGAGTEASTEKLPMLVLH